MHTVKVFLAQLKRYAPMTGIILAKIQQMDEGNASTSVYQSTTGIRNNLVSLLITKVNIILKQGIKCYEWKPSEKFIKIKPAKSVTSKNVTLRKYTEYDN